MKRILIYIAIIALSSILFSMNLYSADFRLSNWQSHTSLLNGNDCTVENNEKIWFSTEGGIFSWDMSTQKIDAFRNIDALMSLSVTSITYNDQYKTLFVGQEEGWLDLYHDGKWQHINDIVKASNFPNKRINSIVFKNNIAYIGGGFGLALFDIEQGVFLENVLRIGTFQTNTEINRIRLRGNEIWLSTMYGIAKAEITSQLTNPASWTNFVEGLPESGTNDFGFENETLYCNTEKTMFYLNNENTFDTLFTLGWPLNKKIDNKNSKLFYSTEFGIYDLTQKKYQHPSKNRIIGLATAKLENSDYLVYFEENAGFTLISETDTLDIIPNTPIANTFMDITTSPDGSVWIATDHLNLSYGKSFLRYKNNEWTVYDRTHEQIGGDNYNFNRIACDNTGKIFVSCHGQGLWVGTPSENNEMDFKNYTDQNSPIYGTRAGYNLPGEVKIDPFGTAWIVNNGHTTPGDLLVSFDKDNVFRSFKKYDPANYRYVYALGIDIYGTKWVGGYPGAGKGLFYFNEMNTPDDPSDDISGIINTGQYPNLLSNEQSTIESDYSGMVWIGTPNGLTFMVSPNLVLQGQNPVFATVESLSGQVINDIYIDAQNLKWIATASSGVWVLDGTGEEVIAHIDKDSSPLTTNDVKAICVNEQTGEVFFGTTEGLYIAQSLSVKPAEEYSINCYPQPFNLNKDEEVIIDGLASQSAIRIMSVNGETVRSFETKSRIAVWDGRDTNGNLVSPGVYLVIVASNDSDKSGVGKIAVIKK